VSAHTAFDQIDHEYSLSLRLRPHTDHDYNYRYDRLTQQAHTQPHKQLSTILKQEFSDKFTQYVLSVEIGTKPTTASGPPPLSGRIQETQIAQLTKDQKSTIADLLGH
jgi:hypothetical protein